jgi:hypothetical protein
LGCTPNSSKVKSNTVMILKAILLCIWSAHLFNQKGMQASAVRSVPGE